MTFAAIVTFGPDLSRLPELRPAHRAYLAELREAGKLALSGPFGDLRGGMSIFQAESEQEVDAILKRDPYTAAGIFQSWQIRPWTIVAARRELLPATGA
jgi:uncharacterized protein YciI